MSNPNADIFEAAITFILGLVYALYVGIVLIGIALVVAILVIIGLLIKFLVIG